MDPRKNSRCDLIRPDSVVRWIQFSILIYSQIQGFSTSLCNDQLFVLSTRQVLSLMLCKGLVGNKFKATKYIFLFYIICYTSGTQKSISLDGFGDTYKLKTNCVKNAFKINFANEICTIFRRTRNLSL